MSVFMFARADGMLISAFFCFFFVSSFFLLFFFSVMRRLIYPSVFVIVKVMSKKMESMKQQRKSISRATTPGILDICPLVHVVVFICPTWLAVEYA